MPIVPAQNPAAEYLAKKQEANAYGNPLYAKGPTPFPADNVAAAAPAEAPLEAAPAAAPATDMSSLENAQAGALANYAKSLAGASNMDIIEKMRLKTGGVSDIDQRLDEVRAAQAAVRPTLMAKYADLDPAQRESIIAGEENRLANESARYTNLRTSRLGAQSEMIQAELTDRQNKLAGQQALVQLYGSVLGDRRNAELAQKQLEQNAQQMKILEETLKQNKIQTQASAAAAGIEIPSNTWTGATFVQRPAGSTNVGRDLNNPGNITADVAVDGRPTLRSDVEAWAKKNYPGAIGVQQSPNGRYYLVFPDMATGQAAAASLVNSRTAYPDTMTVSEFVRKYSGSANPAYVETVKSLTGGSENTTLGQIDRSKLLAAVQRHEGSGATDSPAVAQFLSSGKQKSMGVDDIIAKINKSSAPDEVASRLTPEQAMAILQSPKATTLPQVVSDKLIDLVPKEAADRLATEANIREAAEYVKMKDADKLGALLVSLAKPPKGRAPASFEQLKAILNGASLDWSSGWPGQETFAEKLASKIKKDIPDLAAELE